MGQRQTTFSYRTVLLMAVSGGIDLPTKALSFCHQCCWAGPHSAVCIWTGVQALPPTDPRGAGVRAAWDTSCTFTSRGLPQLPASFIFLMLCCGQIGTELLFFCVEEGGGLEAWVHSGRLGSLKTVSSVGEKKGEWCSLLSGN